MFGGRSSSNSGDLPRVGGGGGVGGDKDFGSTTTTSNDSGQGGSSADRTVLGNNSDGARQQAYSLISLTPPASTLINSSSSKQQLNGGGADRHHLAQGLTEVADGNGEAEERQGFLSMAPKRRSLSGKTKDGNHYETDQQRAKGKNQTNKIKLARQETSIDEHGDYREKAKSDKYSKQSLSCTSRMLRFVRRKGFYVPVLLIIFYIAAIYCVPFLEFEPKTVEPYPSIPFNYKEGPLKASSASQIKAENLFKDQIHGPESVAVDSQGNIYMAIEGGFILYAHMNKSSAIKRAYYHPTLANIEPQNLPNLIKIAELNGLKSTLTITRRIQRENTIDQPVKSIVWRRECQSDEQIYGQHLYSPQSTFDPAKTTSNKSLDKLTSNFTSHVPLSRCSKPLGVRLSPDENYLYVIDTLSGLYKINLRQYDKFNQCNVTRLVDFRANKGHLVLPAVQLDIMTTDVNPTFAPLRFLNVSMKAVDDLVVDFGAGTGKSADVIYMTLATQNWPAVSFVYDILEGRPSGLILRLDTGINQLVALEPARVAHVRTSRIELGDDYHNGHTQEPTTSQSVASMVDGPSASQMTPYSAFGAPRMDENDIFDDRPLHFPNGLELTDDRQALLIADTANKRIIKHYIRGPRRGTSDLWAWTPNFPDNIRRGFDKHHETYWVVGCGRDESRGRHLDAFVLLRPWPSLRKLMVKNIYFFGSVIEWFGAHVLNSVTIRDMGYSIKTGSSLCENGCTGMMILQYNQHGELVKSIHSHEFPNDLFYYSQVNELIDANNQEHLLYLSSPSYRYLTKLTLPTESYDHEPTHLNSPLNR